MEAKAIHILLVEDEEAHAELIRRAFFRQGERVSLTVAGTLGEARARLANSVPDLVVVDARLPDGNGIELLPNDKEEASLPVVVITGHGDEQVAVEAIKRGALDYVVKSETTLADAPHIVQQALRQWDQIHQRKQAVEELRESEEKYRTLVETSPDAVITTDLELKITYASRRTLELHGLRHVEELLGKNALELVVPEQHQRARAAIRKLRATGILKSAEFTLLTESGIRFTAELSAALIRDAQGAPRGFFAITRDVSECKRNEQALRESEAKYRILVERIPAITYVAALDEERTTLYVSPQVEPILGWRPSAYRADPHRWHRHLYPEDRERVTAEVTRTRDSGVPFVSEYRMIARDGRLVWVHDEAALVRDGAGNLLFLQGVVVDITRRRQAEEALKGAHEELEQRVRQRTAELAAANRKLCDEIADRARIQEALRASEERFRMAFEEGPLGVAISGLDGKLLTANRALCDMLGYAEEELAGKTVFDLMDPQDGPADRAASGRLLAGQVPKYTLEVRCRRKDGQLLWVRVTGAAIRDGKGEIRYKLRMFEDITDRKQALEREEKLRADLAHLARVNTVGEMCAGLAHELNQPLASIVVRAEVAAAQLKHQPRKRREDLVDSLEQIAHDAYRAGQIIRRTRDFVRKVAPYRTGLDLPTLVAEVVSLVQNDFRHADIKLAVEIDPSLPNAQGDKIQVQQVLLNLVRNALEAMEDNERNRRQLRIHAEARKDMLEIAVRDSGRGITGNGHGDPFEAFYSTKPGGMGMGLAISQSIVEAHGGRIWAAQNPDCGATFTFTLPIDVGETSHGSENHSLHC